jgi:hypothetical protein
MSARILQRVLDYVSPVHSVLDLPAVNVTADLQFSGTVRLLAYKHVCDDNQAIDYIESDIEVWIFLLHWHGRVCHQ